jgi:hypothetical protein
LFFVSTRTNPAAHRIAKNAEHIATAAVGEREDGTRSVGTRKGNEGAGFSGRRVGDVMEKHVFYTRAGVGTGRTSRIRAHHPDPADQHPGHHLGGYREGTAHPPHRSRRPEGTCVLQIVSDRRARVRYEKKQPTGHSAAQGRFNTSLYTHTDV